MAESAVLHLLANFTPFLQEEVNLLTGVREEIEYIRDEFERMTAFLRVADAMEENNPELKVWVKQVREAAYDTRDVLDTFMLRLGHHHGNGFCGFLCKISCFIMTLKARRQIASKEEEEEEEPWSLRMVNWRGCWVGLRSTKNPDDDVDSNSISWKSVLHMRSGSNPVDVDPVIQTKP